MGCGASNTVKHLQVQDRDRPVHEESGKIDGDSLHKIGQANDKVVSEDVIHIPPPSVPNTVYMEDILKQDPLQKGGSVVGTEGNKIAHMKDAEDILSGDPSQRDQQAQHQSEVDAAVLNNADDVVVPDDAEIDALRETIKEASENVADLGYIVGTKDNIAVQENRIAETKDTVDILNQDTFQRDQNIQHELEVDAAVFDNSDDVAVEDNNTVQEDEVIDKEASENAVDPISMRYSVRSLCRSRTLMNESSLHEPCLQNLPKVTSCPAVVLNCANIGHRYAQDVRCPNGFDWRGVRAAIDYYLKHYCVVHAVCPAQLVHSHPYPMDFERSGYSNFIQKIPVRDGFRDLDDLCGLMLAERYDCQLVDNDNYRDWTAGRPGSEQVAEFLNHRWPCLRVSYFFDSHGNFYPSLKPGCEATPVVEEPPQVPEVHFGRIRVINEARGFSFIQPSDGSEDLYARFANLEPGLRPGDLVQYEQAPNPKKPGKLMAMNVFLVS